MNLLTDTQGRKVAINPKHVWIVVPCQFQGTQVTACRVKLINGEAIEVKGTVLEVASACECDD